MKIKVSIVGAAGYTAGELIRILLRHPQAEFCELISNSQAGQPVTHTHGDLIGETDAVFVPEFTSHPDVVFLCQGHGKSGEWLKENTPPDSTKIIDLSNEFREESPGHSFVYGLPEWQKDVISASSLVANPGCFATTIQLGLLPLAAGGFLTEDVNTFAVTGSTGAGQNPTDSTHFSRRHNNLSVYKAFSHQHVPEIHQSLKRLQPGWPGSVLFIPVKGNFTRGILAVSHIQTSLPLSSAIKLYEEYYAASPFVFLSGQNPDIKQVVNTNKCLLHLQKEKGRLIIISVADNLLKGASGQAVQNMNLMFGLDETTGLMLKPVAF